MSITGFHLCWITLDFALLLEHCSPFFAILIDFLANTFESAVQPEHWQQAVLLWLDWLDPIFRSFAQTIRRWRLHLFFLWSPCSCKPGSLSSCSILQAHWINMTCCESLLFVFPKKYKHTFFSCKRIALILRYWSNVLNSLSKLKLFLQKGLIHYESLWTLLFFRHFDR